MKWLRLIRGYCNFLNRWPTHRLESDQSSSKFLRAHLKLINYTHKFVYVRSSKFRYTIGFVNLIHLRNHPSFSLPLSNFLSQFLTYSIHINSWTIGYPATKIIHQFKPSFHSWFHPSTHAVQHSRSYLSQLNLFLYTKRSSLFLVP